MKNNNSNGGKVTVAGVMGAVGVGVAVVATKALSDEKTRGKIMDTVNDIKDHVVDSVHDAQTQSVKAKKEMKGKFEEEKKKVRKMVNK